MAKTNRQLVTDVVAAWNDHNLERLAGLYAPDYEGVDVGQANPQHGPEEARRSMAGYLLAFPDLHFTLDSTIMEDNCVVLAWTARGTHQGRLMHIPPTGHPIEMRGVSLFTVEGNKITRGLHIWDVAGFLRAVGLLPELE
jgi:steroid delta-isomerase-like uncharacterized protein